jgi:endo-1,4-beta-xylanase
MRRFSILSLVLVFLLVISQSFWLSCCCSGSKTTSPALEPDWIVWSAAETELLQGTQERIQKYRQGDAKVVVVDSKGMPLSDTTVSVEMLKHDFLFGSGLFKLYSIGDEALEQAYSEAFVRLFNYATLPFYWNDYEPSPGKCQEANLKGLASWAKEQGLTTCGHPLVWTESVPDWVPTDSEGLEQVLQRRVTTTVSSFRGLVDFWDVVNEPTLAARYENPVGQWMKAQTPTVATATALGWARDSSPEASLIVNDFRTDDAYYNLLKDVQRQGGEFDIIGIQTHMHMGTYPLDQVWAICERFKELDIPIHFTEVTVLSGDLKRDSDWNSFHPGWETTLDGENTQAAYTEALYRLLFSHPSVQAITWWDFSDLGAWQGAPAGLLRKDMTPKPAYNRLMKLIHEEWWTRAEIKTNVLGQASFRGFYGQYRLTALRGDKRAEEVVYLKQGQKNVFTIQLGD